MLLPKQFCRYSDSVGHYLDLRRNSSIGGMKYTNVELDQQRERDIESARMEL
jgi:hypothetical protein